MCGLGDIDIITEFFHFAAVFQSETSKWLKSLYFTIIIRSFNLKIRPFKMEFGILNLELRPITQQLRLYLNNKAF